MVEHVEGPKKREFFVAHEFTEDKDDLRSAINQAVGEHIDGPTPYYADKEVRNGHIFLNKIIPRIQSAEFGIYDISTNNSNVLLELGAAMILNVLQGKPYYIICRKGTKIPANLQGIDRIEYKGFRDLTKQLRQKVVTSKSRKHLEDVEGRYVSVHPPNVQQVMRILGEKSKKLELPLEILRVINEVYPDYMNSGDLMEKISIPAEKRELEATVAELEELGDVEVMARSSDDWIGMVKITAQGRKRI